MCQEKSGQRRVYPFPYVPFLQEKHVLSIDVAMRGRKNTAKYRCLSFCLTKFLLRKSERKGLNSLPPCSSPVPCYCTVLSSWGLSEACRGYVFHRKLEVVFKRLQASESLWTLPELCSSQAWMTWGGWFGTHVYWNPQMLDLWITWLVYYSGRV